MGLEANEGPKIFNSPGGEDLIIILPKGRTMLPEMRWMRFEVYIRLRPDVEGGVEMAWPFATPVPDEVTGGS
jgi:hypothetical protein